MTLLACLGCCASAAAAEGGATLEGVVTRVIDGDSLRLRVDGEERAIRLSEIDAPELDQPHGPDAMRALHERALGRNARAIVVDTDRYGRTVADVWIDGAQINHEMVRLGHAWAYTRYAKSLEIIELEDAARRAGRGLWQLDPAERTAPWEWRRQSRRTTDEPSEAVEAEPVVCGLKTRCAQMQSCEEARRYLTKCDQASLDGDRDGIPCESLCR
jgi:endonuclease YncB( thermonuclease family)